MAQSTTRVANDESQPVIAPSQRFKHGGIEVVVWAESVRERRDVQHDDYRLRNLPS